MAKQGTPQRAGPSRINHREPVPSGRRWQWQKGNDIWLRLTPHMRRLTLHMQKLGSRWKALRRGHQLLIVSAAATLVVLGGILIAINGGGSAGGPISGGSSRSLGTADPAIKNFRPAHRSSSSNTPESAAAALQVPRALATVLARWDAGPGGAALAQVTGDLGDAMQASGVRQFGSMKQACASLATAVARAQTARPVPNAKIQRSYGQVLAQLAGAAAKCGAGISLYPTEDQGLQARENPSILHRAESELAAGAQNLHQATADITAARSRTSGV
jgi:hypothetical protein